jgi:hypothetical protein
VLAAHGDYVEILNLPMKMSYNEDERFFGADFVVILRTGELARG